jgi:hypothetical protein
LTVGGQIAGDLLIVPGPLGFNLRGAGRLFPRLETGELAAHDLPVRGRAASWLDLAPRIGSNIFLKLFTHGTQEDNLAMLLTHGLDDYLDDIQSQCAARGYRLFFVSAWKMWEAINTIRTGATPLVS